MSQEKRSHRRDFKRWPKRAVEKEYERKLKDFAPFIRAKAFEFASITRHGDTRRVSGHDVEDFQQEGRIGLLKAFRADRPKKTPAYYRAAVERAMIDASRKVHRRNGVEFHVQRDEDGNVKRHKNGKPLVKTVLQPYRAQPSANELFGGLLWGDDPDEQQQAG